MLSWRFRESNGQKTLIKAGFAVLVVVACVMAVGWQSAAGGPSGVGLMNQVMRLDTSVGGDVNELPPVLQTHGVPARVAGSCVKTRLNKSSDDVVHVTLHWKGHAQELNLTGPTNTQVEGDILTENETRMLSSIRKAVSPEEFVEAGRLEWLDTRSGRKKSMVIHVRRDAPGLAGSDATGFFSAENASNASATPSQLRTFIQETQLSITSETVRVPVVDVIAGCELLKEGTREFSLNVEKTAGGQVYSKYMTVEMLAMTGCETGGAIFGEFRELDGDGGATMSVTCKSATTSFCQVEKIGTSASLIDTVDSYEKVHGNGPLEMDTKDVGKVLGDALPEHVSGLGLQVNADCFGGKWHYFKCLAAVLIGIPLFIIFLIVAITSSGEPTLAFTTMKWLFSGFGGGGKQCFPRGIGILLATGQVLGVEKLNPGSAVWGVGGRSNLIYMTGHRDHGAWSEFVWVTTASGRQVGASRGHFGIVFDDLSRNEKCHAWKSDAKTAWTWGMFDACHVHKRFEKFLGGHAKKWSVFVHGGGSGSGSAVFLEEVTSAELRMGVGLYNPYSMDGTLIANGILVSAHSEWILDDLVPDRYDDRLPQVYQRVFSPIRWMYRVCPRCMIEADRRLERGAGEYNPLEIIQGLWRGFVAAQIGESLL